MNKSNWLIACVLIVSIGVSFTAGATEYYVNDGSNLGDVYTTTLGHDLNSGLTFNDPKATLQSVLDAYDIEPGDTIYIDTGLYATTTNTVLTGSDGGNVSNAVSIIGSPNVAAGGTVFDKDGVAAGAAGLQISGATNVWVQHIEIRSWGTGFLVDGGSTSCVLRQCRVQSDTLFGVMIDDTTTSAVLENCVFSQQFLQAILVLDGTLVVENCTILNAESACIRIDGGELHLNNSIVISRNHANCCIWISGGTYFGNHNNLVRAANTFVGFIEGTGPATTLTDWQNETGQDTDSLNHEPLLADESAGDVHVKSLTGRFDPTVGSFVIDAEHSPSIDAGSPSSMFTNEPAPNGSRVNQGAYGNTAEASKSRTDSDQTIDFPVLSDKLTTDTVGLAATASSGLTVTFAVVSGPAAISGGTNLTFTATGSVSIIASQPGNGSWNPAPDVTNTFTVTAPTLPLEITTASLPSGMTGGSYTAQLEATNGMPPYAWSGGVLPEGLSCNTNGVVSGTPTQAGTNRVTFVVQDGSGATTNQELEIVIQAAAPAAPAATAATDVTTTSCSANWEASASATNYFLDVATEASFSNLVAGLNNLATGDVLTWPVTGLSPGQTVYYRVRAQNGSGTSANSDPITVQLIPDTNTEATLYYVNDGTTVGDVYTTAIGNDANSGLAPSVPKATLQAILDAYDIEPGDTIYVDTGLYATDTDTVVTGSDGGNASNAVSIIGSPNVAAGGTVLVRSGTEIDDIALEISGATQVRVQHIRVRSGGIGFAVVDGSDSCVLLQCQAETNTYAGVVIADEGSSARVQNCVFVRHPLQAIVVEGGSLDVENCTVLNTAGVGLRIDDGELHLSNSIVLTRSSGVYGIWIQGGTYTGNHNNLAHDADVPIGSITGTGPIATLTDWQNATGQDADSLCHDPLLADEAAGDVHLKSQMGRFDPSFGAFDMDSIYSPSIDAGSTLSIFFNEPAPNGSRINQGAYGNTAEASKSRTNSALVALSFNDGGTAQGVVALRWLYFGMSPAETVFLQYSSDSGVTWETISFPMYADTGGILWDTSLYHDTWMGMWRIVSSSNPEIWDAVDAPFTIASGPQIVAPDPLGMVLQWYGEAGREYRVRSTTTGLDGDWATCQHLITTNGAAFGCATGANETVVVIDTNYNVNAKTFYAIESTEP